MPFTFAYMMCLFTWISFSCAIWCVAAGMCTLKKTRPFAWPIALGMAATFPFVLAYQVFVLPLIVTVMLLALGVSRLIETPVQGHIHNKYAIIAILAGLVVSFAFGLLASITGFIDGWRAGWSLARGRSAKETWLRTFGLRQLVRIFARLRGLARGQKQ